MLTAAETITSDVADLIAGAHLVQGILACLVRRGVTGEGGLVEVSLLESVLDLQFEVLTTHLNDGGLEPRRSAVNNAHAYLSAPYGIYATADGYLALAMTPIPRLGELIGCDALLAWSDQSQWFTERDAIKADPELSALLHVQDHIRTITHRTTGATLQVVAADSDAVAGKKWAVTLVDELWLFGKRPNADRMLLEATGGMASRPEGFVMYLSTQSDEPPAGVFAEKLKYARGVRDGKVNDPAFLPVLYEFPKEMVESGEARRPENFGVVNPNLGASVDEEYLAREMRKAEESGEEAVRGFLAKHLNVEIGLALRQDRWAGAEFWERAADRSLTLPALLERCDVVTIGIDGGGLDDLLGVAVLGREADTGRWLAWCHAWAHPVVLERRKSEAARLKDFERDGDLTLVDEVGQDVAEVCAVVEQVLASGLLDKVGVDPAGIGAILDALLELGLEEPQVVGISQGWRLAGAIKTTERKVAAGELRHAGAPLMAWCVGNARIEPRANAIMVTKQASGTAKIDPLMAAFNAVALMVMNPKAKGRSYLGSSDLMVL